MALADIRQRPGVLLGAAILLHVVLISAQVNTVSGLPVLQVVTFGSFAEVQRGLFETNGVMHRLPRLIGMGRAAHVMMTGEKISAQSALELGLVTRVVPSEILLNKGLELARMLAANAPISMRLVKQVLNKSYDLDLESVMQLETEATLECLASEDLQEGVQSFLETRAPIYKGK